MPRFKTYNYDQHAMLVIHYQDHLQPWEALFEQVPLVCHEQGLLGYQHRVDSPKDKEIYSHRMSVVEPLFGNIGTMKRLNRSTLGGKKKVQGHCQLYCLVHNMRS